MLLLKSIRRPPDRSMVRPREAPTSVHVHSAPGFDAQTLAWMLDSLVRVSRRAADHHYASILAEARSSIRAGRMPPRAVTLPEGSHVPGAFVRPPAPMLACLAGECTPGRAGAERSRAGLVAGASLSTISRTVALSFQSPFHLSITLLVRYRSPAGI